MDYNNPTPYSIISRTYTVWNKTSIAMGVRGLLSYIVEHKDKATERVDLKSLAKEEKVVLFCDLSNVVSRLDQKILHSQVHSLPDLCGFYGGDLKLLAQQFNNFITALNHLGIKVIFVSDAPFGANEVDFHEKLEEKNRRQLEKRQQIEDWSKWDSFKPKPYPFRCSLAIRVCYKVLLDRKEELVISHTEADHWIISHFEEKKAFGVLSDDSDFGVSRTCRLIPLGLFELQGFHDGSINPEPRSLMCRYTDRRLLSRSLGIRQDQLTHLAIIRGNDFTKSFNVYEDIGICVKGKKGMQVIEEVSWWLQRNNFHTDATLKKKAKINWMFKRACEESENFYEGRLIESKCTNKRFLDRVQTHQLSPRFLAIENNRYWHEVLPEPPELCGKAHECTKKLRKVLYSLCGCTHVVESGKIQGMHKDVCEEVVETGSIPIYSAGCKHLPTMVAHLCQITADKGLDVRTHEYPCDVSDRSLVRGAVIASTLNYVLSNPAVELDQKFKMSFLFAVATCSLDLSKDEDILKNQRSVRIHRWMNAETVTVVSLSAIFMATLPIVYNIARFLGLTDYLPNMADMFSPAVFVPTMVQRLTTQYGNAPPQLLELNPSVADCSSTATIRNLCLFVGQFENAVNFVRRELRPH